MLLLPIRHPAPRTIERVAEMARVRQFPSNIQLGLYRAFWGRIACSGTRRARFQEEWSADLMTQVADGAHVTDFDVSRDGHLLTDTADGVVTLWLWRTEDLLEAPRHASG